jgi:putative transposase
MAAWVVRKRSAEVYDLKSCIFRSLLLFERGIDICHETVRLWWNRFGPMFAAEIRKKRVDRMRFHTHWRWHLDEVYVKINGEMRYLWRAVDHEGEVLESYVTKTRDKAAARYLY